jgi:alpha-tubulin suppressor-like RCC1 family protein
VRCWGPTLAWTGAPPKGDRVTALGALSASGGARELALGDGFACAVEADGKVRCAGKDDHGERAGAAHGDANVVEGLGPAVEIATDSGLVCARLASGKVACWGAVAMEPGESDEKELVTEGEEVELAYGVHFARFVPRKERAVAQRSPRLLPEVEAAAEPGRVRRELCAVRGGGALCWSRESALAAKPVAVPAGTVALVGDMAPSTHRCALLADGRVSCWGSGTFGAAGALGADLAEPTPVPGVTDAVQVVAGWHFTCARKKDGSVWCWGSDRAGELGDGADWTSREEPVDVALR